MVIINVESAPESVNEASFLLNINVILAFILA